MYDPESKGKKFKHPMNWSRVLDVYSVKDNNVKSWDVEKDLEKDKVLQ